MADPNDISGAVLDASIKMHRDLGPGLLESAYEQVLAASLTRRGFQVARQVPIDIRHDGLHILRAFRADMIVEGIVLIEIKSCERLTPAFTRQVLTYLRLARLQLGLLINFGGDTLMEGFRRFAYSAPSASSARNTNAEF